MEWLSWFFLESVTALAIALGLALFWLLVIWRRGGSSRPLLVGLALSAVLLIVQQVVQTPREHAARILTSVERDVALGRTGALAEALAATFRAADMDRAAFLGYARDQLRTVRVQWLRRGELRIESPSSDRFLADVGYQAGVVLRETAADFVPSRWRITFGRTDTGWQIIAIDPPQIAGQQFRDWNIGP